MTCKEGQHITCINTIHIPALGWMHKYFHKRKWVARSLEQGMEGKKKECQRLFGDLGEWVAQWILFLFIFVFSFELPPNKECCTLIFSVRGCLVRALLLHNYFVVVFFTFCVIVSWNLDEAWASKGRRNNIFLGLKKKFESLIETSIGNIYAKRNIFCEKDCRTLNVKTVSICRFVACVSYRSTLIPEITLYYHVPYFLTICYLTSEILTFTFIFDSKYSQKKTNSSGI